MKVIYVVNGSIMCYKCCLTETIQSSAIINPIAISSDNSGLNTSCIRCGKILGCFNPNEIQESIK